MAFPVILLTRKLRYTCTGLRGWWSVVVSLQKSRVSRLNLDDGKMFSSIGGSLDAKNVPP